MSRRSGLRAVAPRLPPSWRRSGHRARLPSSPSRCMSWSAPGTRCGGTAVRWRSTSWCVLRRGAPGSASLTRPFFHLQGVRPKTFAKLCKGSLEKDLLADILAVVADPYARCVLRRDAFRTLAGTNSPLCAAQGGPGVCLQDAQGGGRVGRLRDHQVARSGSDDGRCAAQCGPCAGLPQVADAPASFPLRAALKQAFAHFEALPTQEGSGVTAKGLRTLRSKYFDA